MSWRLVVLVVLIAVQAPAMPIGVTHAIWDAGAQRLLLIASPPQESRLQLWSGDGTTWRRLDQASSPPARELGGAAYDSRRRRLVLHGGLAPSGDHRGDTWEWDGTAWREIPGATLGPRDHHAIAYDERRGRTVLFGGGRSENLESDTWEWDGARWARVATTGPGGRAHFGMVYDSTRQRVVIAGGLGEGYRARNDTWMWDGVTWQEAAGPAFTPRTHFRMAFDPVAGVVVLFGGLANGRITQALADTWIFDGQHWTELKIAGPPKRMGHVMAFDHATRRVVLLGGSSFDGATSTRHSDTWAFDGQHWTRIGDPR